MKKRLDQLLVDRNIAESRNKAQALILSGNILVNNQKVEKCGVLIDEKAQIIFIGKKMPYVSRAGIKLEKALDEFNISPKELICLDVGASTGGFSDCLLKRGAKKIYAIDVGYGQMDLKIRNNDKVVVIERTNARYITPEDLYGANFTNESMADLAVIDVSFISLSKILPAVYNLIKEKADVIALVKPQFEAQKNLVGKGGIIKDPKIHETVLEKAIKESSEIGFRFEKSIDSPIKGTDGNKEFFIYLRKGE